MPEAYGKAPAPHVARAGLDPVVALFVLLWAPLPVVALRAAGTAEPGVPAPTSLGTIDPNTAPWWELTALPRIGEGTALAIVTCREDLASAEKTGLTRPFVRAVDLERVRGIGPRTVNRIAPYLRFEN